MRFRLNTTLIAVSGLVLCAAVAWAVHGDGNETEKGVSLEQIPPAVRATVNSETGAGSVHEIEKETVNGVSAYCVDIIRDGKKLDVDIAMDGKLISSRIEVAQANGQPKDGAACPAAKEDRGHEARVTIDQLPPAAQKTVWHEVGAGSIHEIERETVNGAVIYCADVIKGGQKLDIDVTENGHALKAVGDACYDDCGQRHACSDVRPARASAVRDCYDDCGEWHPDCEDDCD
jgi:uncharacterized membrane protein YkoI